MQASLPSKNKIVPDSEDMESGVTNGTCNDPFAVVKNRYPEERRLE